MDGEKRRTKNAGHLGNANRRSCLSFRQPLDCLSAAHRRPETRQQTKVGRKWLKSIALQQSLDSAVSMKRTTGNDRGQGRPGLPPASLQTKAACMLSTSNHRTTAPTADIMAFESGATAVLQVAERLHRIEPEWVVFFREILGVDGVVRRTFHEADSLDRFERSPEYARIREMLDDLRNRQRNLPAERHKHRVITVRMPRSLHETLKAEAEQMRVSINTLCISKLMKLVDEDSREQLSRPRSR